jgi:hypothetical protein
LLGIPRKLKALIRFARSGERAALLSCFTICVLVTLGLWLRVRGVVYQVIPLWLDEASWALALTELPILEQLIRPVGFVAFSKAVATVFGTSEFSLRFLPWVAGLTSTWLAVPLSRRLFEAWAPRLLFIAVIALHPAAIDLAKEFKPYSVSLCLHLCCTLGAASYAQTGRSKWLAMSLLSSSLGILFAQDLVFACAGVYLVLGLTGLRRRRFRHLAIIAVSAVLTVGLILTLYFAIWRHIETGGGSDTVYWGRKYDVFFIDGRSEGTRLAWTLGKLRELSLVPAMRHDFFPPSGLLGAEGTERLREFSSWLWIGLGLAGVATLTIRRRVISGLLLLTPMLVFAVFGSLGHWPFGFFRTNLFTVLYTAGIAAAALDHPRLGRRWASVPALVLVLIPLFLFERGWHAAKQTGVTANCPMPEVLSTLLELQREIPARDAPDLLIFDLAGCAVWDFYTKAHPGYRDIARTLNERFEALCAFKKKGGAFEFARRELRKRRTKTMWFVLQRERDVARFPESLPPDYQIIEKRRLGVEGATLLIGVRGSP